MRMHAQRMTLGAVLVLTLFVALSGVLGAARQQGHLQADLIGPHRLIGDLIGPHRSTSHELQLRADGWPHDSGVAPCACNASSIVF